MSKKLWKKKETLDREIEQFTVGKDRDLDLLLAEWDVIGSLAHVTMLQKVGLVSDADYRLLREGLKEIYRAVQNGRFKIEEGVEDVHSQIELLLTRKLPEAGARLHTGRSRNDQVLLDIRLFTRAQLREIVKEVQGLFKVFIGLSEQYKNVLMPGYTHFQAAMPSSFGLWFGAYAESLVDDLIQLRAAYRIVNKNPLGSAAGYGSSFPLDRTLTTNLLGFDGLNYNSVYAQMGRGRTERVVSEALGGIAETLSRFAADMVLFMSQNFDFVRFPESITTGSSIMPHKKNPDIFEILRARCNRIKALPNEIKLLTTNLPSGYHRDLQLIKERFLPALSETRDCLKILQKVLPEIRMQANILENEKYQYVFSVEAINRLVQKGVPFREAYHRVAKQIENNEFKKPQDLKYTHEGSIGRLCNEEIDGMMGEVLREFDFSKWEKAIEDLIKN
ncbi:MAG: argininosuccinate lyase [Calditrichaeota bacterium]|nr:argininosuccinate lyase [Calditrichota bacterium]